MRKPHFACYDCGSTVAGHHTSACDLAGPHDKKDLPCTWNGKTGNQHWDLTAEQPTLTARYEALRLLSTDDRRYY